MAELPGEIVRWLSEHNCAIHARISQNDHERYNLLINQTRIPLADAPSEQAFLGSTWLVAAKVNLVAGQSDAADFAITFRCAAGKLPCGSVSVDLDFSAWSEKNYVLLPSAAYNGNRYLARRIPYSPKLYYVQDIGPDKPMIITDVPKLSVCDGPSRIQERSGSMATPAIGFRSEKSATGFWLLTLQGNALGDYGIGIEETRGRDRATISITSPVVRELHNYRNCDMQAPSVDVPLDFKAGDEITIFFRVCFFAAPDVQALFDRFAAERKLPITTDHGPRTTDY
ncbi:MAG: hypothetical protein ABSH20_25700 [Tepidisphaeraceae bacterium]|jgi:hypothetical protein